MQPLAMDNPLNRKRSQAPAAHGAVVASGVRNASQQAFARSTAPLRPSAPPPHPLEAQRRTVDVARQVAISGEPRLHVPRAFGAAAIHDEATLEVPAYLRRSRP
jgi:hypothetical protein